MTGPTPPMRLVTVDDAIRSALEATFYRFTLTRPLTLALLGVIVVMLGAMGAAAAIAGASSWLLLVVPVAVVVLWVIGLRIAVHVAYRRVYPPGSWVAASVGDDGLALQTPRGRGRLDYSRFSTVRVTPVAVLMLVGNRSAEILPRGLFSDGDIDLLRAKVGGAPTA